MCKGSNFCENCLLMSKPITAPAENKIAIGRFRVPANAEIPALPMAMIAITPNDELIIELVDRLVYLRRAGTITKPPPTPRSPDKKPETAPILNKVKKQGLVQDSFPVVSFKWQIALSFDFDLTPSFLNISFKKKCIDTLINMSPNRAARGRLGT